MIRFTNYTFFLKLLFIALFSIKSVSGFANFTIPYSGNSSGWQEYAIIAGTSNFQLKTTAFTGGTAFTATLSGSTLTAAVSGTGVERIITVTGTGSLAAGTYSITLAQTGGNSVTVRLVVIATNVIALSKTTLSIPVGTRNFIVPYSNTNRGMATATVAVTGTTGVTANFDRDSLGVSFHLAQTAPAFTTAGTYNLSGTFGTLTLKVFATPTLGDIKFREDFGTVTTWTDTKYGNPTCAVPARYNYYRGELHGTRGQIGKDYTFSGYTSNPTCGTQGSTVADGYYAMVNNPRAGFSGDAWFGGKESQNAYDHTGDRDAAGYRNGLMLLVNANQVAPGVFYKRQVSGLCNGSDVRFSFWAANVLEPRGSVNNIPINIQYEIWESDPGESFTPAQANAFVAGNTYNNVKLLSVDYTGDIPGYYSDYMIWRNYILYYTMPTNRDNVFIILRNRGIGGGGNDLAIDDIKFQVYTPITGKDFNATNGASVTAGKLKLSGTVIGDLAGYYYKWQGSPRGKNIWSDISTTAKLVTTAMGANNLVADEFPFSAELATGDFRMILAKSPDAFANESCYIGLQAFQFGLPFAIITAPVTVCSTALYADFKLRVTFFGAVENNTWKFTYKREDQTPVEYTVKDSTHFDIPQRITATTNFTLISSETGSKRVDMNQTFAVNFNPEAILAGDIQIEGPRKVCVLESYYTYKVTSNIPLPSSTVYRWNAGAGNQIIAGDSLSPVVKIKFNSSTPFNVSISTYSDCLKQIVTVNRNVTPTTLGPDATSTGALPNICACSSCGTYTTHLLSVAPVDEATSYYWSWSSAYSTLIDYKQEDQIPGVTGRYQNKIVIRVYNFTTEQNLTLNVKSINDCGETSKNISLKLDPTQRPTFTLTQNTIKICPNSTYDLRTVGKSNSSLTYTYFRDVLGNQAVTNPGAVSPGIYYIKGTTASGCFVMQAFTVEEFDMTVNLNVLVDASCEQCPVNVRITSGMQQGFDYYLFKDKSETNVARGTKFASNGSLSFNDIAGWYDYYIKRYDSQTGCISNESESQRVAIGIAPSNAIWLGKVSFGDGRTWSDLFNWNTPGAPLWCTDVIIPQNKNSYPLLVDGDACRDIIFENGASVAKVHKLHYRKAFVEFRPDRNRWYMLSTPLKYMYSADYSFTNDGDNNGIVGISPKVFTMYYNQNSPDDNDPNMRGSKGLFFIGNFTKPFTRLEEQILSGQGFALWVNGANYGTIDFPVGSSYRFPRLDIKGDNLTYYYHDINSGKINRPTDALARGNKNAIISDADWLSGHATGVMPISALQKDNQFRFSFEDLITSGSNIKIPLKGNYNAALRTRVVTNPTMSYLDFTKVATSAPVIQPYYRIWDGAKFYTNAIGGKWTGFSTGDEVSTSQFIAPLQSFFVEEKEGETATDIILNLDNVSVVPTDATKLRSSKAKPAISDLLKLKLTMGGYESQAIISLQDAAVATYKSGEDIGKLFSPNAIPEIYTLTEDYIASEINLLGKDPENQIVPVAFYAKTSGTGTLEVSGVESVASYGDVYLFDAVLNKRYDLHNETRFTFEKGADSWVLEGRFYIEFGSKIINGISDTPSDKSGIQIIQRQDEVDIYSQGSVLDKIEVFSGSGKLVVNKEHINSTFYQINMSDYVQGIYLLRVSTDKGTKTFKLIF